MLEISSASSCLRTLVAFTVSYVRVCRLERLIVYVMWQCPTIELSWEAGNATTVCQK
jgi:hypothetical protein